MSWPTKKLCPLPHPPAARHLGRRSPRGTERGNTVHGGRPRCGRGPEAAMRTRVKAPPAPRAPCRRSPRCRSRKAGKPPAREQRRQHGGLLHPRPAHHGLRPHQRRQATSYPHPPPQPHCHLLRRRPCAQPPPGRPRPCGRGPAATTTTRAKGRPGPRAPCRRSRRCRSRKAGQGPAGSQPRIAHRARPARSLSDSPQRQPSPPTASAGTRSR